MMGTRLKTSTNLIISCRFSRFKNDTPASLSGIQRDNELNSKFYISCSNILQIRKASIYGIGDYGLYAQEIHFVFMGDMNLLCLMQYMSDTVVKISFCGIYMS